MKNVSRNKLLLCFRPVDDMKTVIKSKALVDCSSITTLATFLDWEIEEIKPSRTTSSSPTNSTCSDGGSLISRPPKRTLYRKIKRVGERAGYPHNDQQKSYQENESSYLPRSASSFPIPKSKSMSSLSSTSTGCKINKKNRETSNSVKRRKADRSLYAFNSGIGLIVISLAITVMKGRVIAIFFTSIWLYFFAWLHIEVRRMLKKKKEKTSRKSGLS